MNVEDIETDAASKLLPSIKVSSIFLTNRSQIKDKFFVPG